MKGSLMLCCLSLLFAANAQTAYVTESTDFPGSISFDSSAYSVGLLDLGMNTISGSLAGECVSDTHDCNISLGGDSQDSFLVEIGSTARIDSIFVTTSNVSGPSGFDASFDLRDPPSTLYIFEPNLPINATSDNLTENSLGSGIYSLTVFGQNALDSGPYTMDWSVEVNLSPVPIPAALWFFGFGLLGLIGLSKHRKQ